MLNNLMNFAPSQRTSDVPPPPPPPAGISGQSRPQAHIGTGYGSRVDTASLSRHSSGTNSPLGSPPLTPLIDQTIAQPNSIRSTPNLISGPGVGITTPMISTGSVSASAGTIMGQSGSQAGIMQLGRAGIADTSILQTSAPPAADMRRLQAAQKFMYARAPLPVTLGARLTSTTMLTPQQRRAQSVVSIRHRKVLYEGEHAYQKGRVHICPKVFGKVVRFISPLLLLSIKLLLIATAMDVCYSFSGNNRLHC
eukprot:286400_1